jgi:hypothetical protein
MMGFLAVIFYAALSGNALPDAVRKQIEKYVPQSLLAGKPVAEKANDSAAANAATDAPLFAGPQADKSALSINSAPTQATENPAAPRPLAMDGSAAMLTPPANGTASMPVQNNSPVVPVNYQTPAEVSPGAMPTANLPASTADATAPFSQIQNRLKQLGATYYLLETWGNQQQLYRFYCKMAVGGNTNYTHCFEYISADPMQAMGEVLKQVENWRNGGSVVR